MASEESRRVADYFVVCGLPKDDPQLLDDTSLEVSLRSTAHQDPITDITVIFPHLGENTPDYYQQIEFTPSGLPANLNHGSFRAPEVYLCFRRGRDRAPLLDIGVLFEGKDRVDPSSQIIEFTSNGHSANVNNTHNSATYLTYKRATDMSPCNELVVTDICVIVGNKGEVPPHSFKIIDKSLNKGMMGSDVYICYKQSMNRPDLISYKPAIHSRFPLKDNPIYPLDERVVPLFCMPMGANLECWPANSARSAAVSSTFVLTLPTRDKVYGSAITFYEEYHDESLSADQKSLLQMQKYKRKSDRKIFANKCICILSQWPFFEAFENFLFYLHKRQLMGPYDIPLERFISHFLFDVPFPSPERPRILVQLSSVENIALFQPEELHLPRSGASFRQLLCNLGPDNCLLVLLLALTEQNILIHSLRPAVLTSVAEALMQIIFPFTWQCPYIPLCPIGMSDYLSAPLPFVMGMDSRFFDLYELPSNVNAVDLDTNTVTICTTNETLDEKKTLSAKFLPKKPAKQLKTALTHLLEKCANHLKMERKLEATNDGAIDFVFKMKRKEIQLEMEIREAFLQFVVTILSGYSNYLMPITKEPTIGNETDVKSLFDQNGFLRSRDRNHHKFYEMLMRTQMFTKFIEERSFVSDTNTALAFFDECIGKQSKAAHEDNHHQQSNTGLRFLELEGFETDRTVFILPPDTSDLPSGGAYKYDKFENLNPDLFEDRTEQFYGNNNHLVEPYNRDNVPSNINASSSLFTTPSRALAKRTKYEIRSAQKSATKCRNAHQPLSWALCLMSTSYSLWYIHLPGFMLNNKSTPQSLRIGLTVLQRMQRMKMRGHIDEICYRVLMQLCGVYSQPALAVQVLCEMKRVGEDPINAVTYGYYNKAVLESKWPSGDVSHGQILWTKLRNALLAIHMLKKLGKDGNGEFKASIRAHQQQMQLQYETQQKQESKSKYDSKGDLDNVSGSSFESGDSQGSSSNEEHVNTKTTAECSEGFKEASNSEEKSNNNAKEPVSENPITNDEICNRDLKVSVEESTDEVFISKNKSIESIEKSSANVEASDTKEGTKDEDSGDQAFRRRASTIVKTSTSTLPNGEHGKQLPSSCEKEEFKRNINFTHQLNESGVTNINDLNMENLGQDKKIIDLMQGEKNSGNITQPKESSESQNLNNADMNLSANISRHAEQIRGKMSNLNLFGRHNPQGTGVNRALFSEDVEPSKESGEYRNSESFVSEESSEYSGFMTRSSVSKSRSQSVESDEGMMMLDPVSSDVSPNKQVKPLPTVPEMSDSLPQQNPHFLSPTSPTGSPMHKVSSSSSMCVPVTLDDPLGALSAHTSPTNSQSKSPMRLSTESGLTKSATCPSQSLSQVVRNESQFTENSKASQNRTNNDSGSRGNLDDNILGSPFANESNMTRSTTMPVNEKSSVTTTPSSRWAFPKSKLASIRNSSSVFQSTLSALSPSTVTKAKTQDVLSNAWSRGKSAYSNATTQLSKRVEEIKEYQQQQKELGPSMAYPGMGIGVSPAGSNQYLNATDRLKADSVDCPDRVSQCSNDSRRQSDAPFFAQSSDPAETWGALAGQMWDTFMTGYTGGGSEPNSKTNSLPNQPGQTPTRSIFEILEDFYSKLPKRPAGPVAMEIIMTSCSRCRYCSSILYDEEIMSGWTADDSNLNTKCTFCDRMVVPLLTIQVVDFRTRSLVAMKELMTPAQSLETLSSQQGASDASSEHINKSDEKASEGIKGCESSEERNANGDSNATETTNNTTKIMNGLREPIISIPITVPYLSPLVLRKELENMLEREGDTCLIDHSIVDEHPIIYWNLLWYYERVAVKSHLSALCIHAKSLNEKMKDKLDASWKAADERNVHICCKWDNQRLYEESGSQPPIYTCWRVTEPTENKEISEAYLKKILDDQTHEALKPHMQMIIAGVQNNDLLKPIKTILEERKKSSPNPSSETTPKSPRTPTGSTSTPQNCHISVYREIMFLTLVSLGQDNIDLTAFDREYRRAFDNLPTKYVDMALKSDYPPSHEVVFCRKMFRELLI